jgi:hypothetical protein
MRLDTPNKTSAGKAGVFISLLTTQELFFAGKDTKKRLEKFYRANCLQKLLNYLIYS